MVKLEHPRGLYALFLLVLALSGCMDNLQYHDPSLKMTEEDFRSTFTPSTAREVETVKAVANSVPKKGLFDRPVSLVTTSDVPLRELFQGLAAQVGVNLALPERGLEKGVTFRATNQPLGDVVRHLCRLGGLRYEIEENTLFLQPDVPYMKTYDIQFLVGSRETTNNMSVVSDMNCKTDVSRAETRSSTTIQSVSKVDFWKEIEETIQKILMLSRRRTTERLTKDGKSMGESSSKKSLQYAIHKQAGLLSVTCKQHQHRLIQKYLERVKEVVHSQVLIEAKIVEVALKDTYSTGIDWGLFNEKLGLGFSGDFTLIPAMKQPNGSRLFYKNDRMYAALKLMETFGTLRTIANPRLTVLNNQSAVFKVADNEVFFSMQNQRVYTAQNKPDIENVYSQIQTVPIGLVMTVQPSINPKTQEVTLAVKPTISRVSETREDPAVTMSSNGQVKSEVPVVQVREMDSMVTLKPGDVVIMGGLIEKVAAGETTGFPGLRKTWVNHAVGGRSQTSRTLELVIFLTVKLNKRTPDKGHESYLYEKL